MSRHLPTISGSRLVKALQRGGFVILRQRGSHVSMERRNGNDYWRTIIPLHREIRPGTLSDILHQTGLSKDELGKLL